VEQQNQTDRQSFPNLPFNFDLYRHESRFMSSINNLVHNRFPASLAGASVSSVDSTSVLPTSTQMFNNRYPASLRGPSSDSSSASTFGSELESPTGISDNESEHYYTVSDDEQLNTSFVESEISTTVGTSICDA